MEPYFHNTLQPTHSETIVNTNPAIVLKQVVNNIDQASIIMFYSTSNLPYHPLPFYLWSSYCVEFPKKSVHKQASGSKRFKIYRGETGGETFFLIFLNLIFCQSKWNAFILKCNYGWNWIFLYLQYCFILWLWTFDAYISYAVLFICNVVVFYCPTFIPQITEWNMPPHSEIGEVRSSEHVYLHQIRVLFTIQQCRIWLKMF